MLAIFHDMIKESVKVFMDDFSVFGNSFDTCLNNLDKMLQRCKDAHLVLNWEKCHFMVKEGIVLGHKVSSARLEVDKAKIDVISKLPPPTNIKADHLSRIENDETSDDNEFDDNFHGETLMEINTKDEPWKVEESLNVTFNETPPPSKTSPLVDDVLDEEEAIKVTNKKNLENDIEDETLEIDEIVNIKEPKNHPLENVIGNLNQRKLVAQGYNQQEGTDYDETYAPVARLESIRTLLAYACALDFKLFQIDVKGAFLNGFINEEVYVAQPPGFIDFEKPDHVYKLKKAL
ncbi:retrovirus-related pol polyprotein from transposon TNT 1-94 [Tanacetum coccineum]